MTIVLPALVVWGLSGVIVAWLLSRHGHNFWLLAFMGLGYGPLVLLIWLRGVQGQSTKSQLIQSNGILHAEGWIDVLIGLDGTTAAVESVAETLRTLGPSVRRVRLTSVLDHEVSNSSEMFLVDERRTEYLHDAAVALGFANAEITLLSGQPDKALQDHARSNGFDLLLVAHRRDSLKSGLRGSTVGRLARNSQIPVLIGPPATD